MIEHAPPKVHRAVRRALHGTPGRGARRARRRAPLAAGAGLAAVALAASSCISAAAVANQTLTITGSPGNDTIVLRLRAGDPNTLDVDDGDNGSVEFSFDRSTFTAIDLEGGAGDDVLRIDHSNGQFTDTEATTLGGGDGNDTLIGDIGSEHLDGGNGNDTIDGNIGNDVILAGDGDDTVQWQPGDGSDVVEGGPGTDRLAFDGAAANEQFDVSPNGGRVRLTRNVGAITMDMDDVETLDVAMKSGTDVLTMHDVTGTDLTTVDADLAASGGGDDAAQDEVVVPPGKPISQDGVAGTVGGLGALVRVLNGSSNDRIHVVGTTGFDSVSVQGTAGPDAVSATADGTDVAITGATPGARVELTAIDGVSVGLGAGADTFTASGNLAALTSLSVDGGPDADNLSGGNGIDTLQGGTGDDTLDGNQGNDVILAGDGNDTIRWDPGDGNDVIEGGKDDDRFQFNGAAIGEVFELLPNGGRTIATRNVGSIVTDLNDVETVDVKMLAGSDVLNLNALPGTDVKTVNANLAGVGGGDDGAADQVVFNGTGGNDSFVVTDAPGTVSVAGVGALLNITGSTAALDRLTVNGLDGTDAFSVTSGVSSLIQLNLVP